jgi:nitrile hydratase beta subunit
VNGIHDVGGADGFGPITIEVDEPVFHAEWERPAFSLFAQGAVAGYFNLDEFRAAIERMDPVDYLTTPYYAHWMHAVEEHLTRDDAEFPAELERRTQEFLADPRKALPSTVNHDLAEVIGTLAYAGAPCDRDVAEPPMFAIGDRVLVSATVPVTHTRKAGYVRGMTGEIVLHHGGWVFPDSNATGGGEAPQHVYSVRFTSEDLYGKGIGDPNTYVVIDLWESYLTQAGT